MRQFSINDKSNFGNHELQHAPLAIDIIINERKIEKPALSNIVIGLIANCGIQLSESNKTKWTLHVKSLFLLRSYGYYLIKNSSQKEILKYECSKIF